MMRGSVGSPGADSIGAGRLDTGLDTGLDNRLDREPVGGVGPASTAGPASDAWTLLGPGTLLGGRYELGASIGNGGMATVYRAYDRQAERHVAVKVFRPVAGLADAEQRYRREVELHSTLNDAGLVTVLDYSLAVGPGGHPRYLVTELVEGPTLAQHLEAGAHGDAEIARLGAALCRTLAYIHDRGIVHRDIKPANILLRREADDPIGRPKLIDFGIALTADRARLTSSEATLGTANYLSPEQVRGQPVTSACDIYALGLVLIEARTGALAYPGGGVEAALARLTHPPAIPNTTAPALSTMLMSMVALDPDERPDARLAAHRLEQLAATTQSDAATSDIHQPARAPNDRTDGHRHVPPHRRRRTIAVVGAAVLAASGILTGIVSAVIPSPPPATASNQSARPSVAARPTARPAHGDRLTPAPARATLGPSARPQITEAAKPTLVLVPHEQPQAAAKEHLKGTPHGHTHQPGGGTKPPK